MSAQTKTKKKKYFRSLMVTVAIAFLTLSLVVLLISSILDIYFSIKVQRKAIASQQQLIAQDAARTVKTFFQEKFTTLEAAVSIGDILVVRPDEQKLILDKLFGIQRSPKEQI